MNADHLLWTLVLLSLGAVLLCLPFWPAWSEWRHPQDPLPMGLNAPEAREGAHTPLHLAPGAHFGHLQSDSILLGNGALAPSAPWPALQRWQPPPAARPWGLNGWFIPHDLKVPAGHLVPCSLVVRGRLWLEGNCRVQGDIKAQSGLHIGQACQVQGNVFSEGDIHLDEASRVSGVVMAEGHLHLSPHVVIGHPRQPVSVCADVIDVHGPVQVHGALQARITGQVQAPT